MQPAILEPIEPFIRAESPPDNTIVVVRGGPVAAAKLVEHALRQAREYSYCGRAMFSISVSLAVDGWELRRLLEGPLGSRSTVAISTAGAVGRAGFTLLPTFEVPHYDLLLASADYREAEFLLTVFGAPEPNPYKRRRG